MICYIKKLETIEESMEVGTYKIPKIIKKIVFKIKCIFNVIVYKPINDSSCILLISRINEKTINKVIIKLKKNNIKTVAIANNIMQFKNQFECNKIKVLNGRWLFSFFIDDIIQDLSSKKEEPISSVTVLIKKSDRQIENNIELILQRIKSLNIVTENIKSFESLESYLYSKYGIMITVSNNKKKSLSKCDIIVNFDFTENDIKKYHMKENATIVNVNYIIKQYNKSFKGKVINDYEITLNKHYVDFFKQYNLYNSFEKNILYESILFTKSNDCFYNVRNRILTDKIKTWNLK